MKNPTVRKFASASLFATAGLFMIGACEKNPGDNRQGGAAHILKGNIHIANDCDAKTDSIPDEVIISADLSNGNNVQVPTNSGKITVKHKATDGNPTKDGDYSMTANWPATGAGDADGKPVCKSITCPTEHPKCTDIAQKAKTIPIDPSGTTTEDLKVTCSCGN
jgi:hypothetical protein